jgi:hypothetical protein
MIYSRFFDSLTAGFRQSENESGQNSGFEKQMIFIREGGTGVTIRTCHREFFQS